MSQSETEHFVRLIGALDPWIQRVVIIGGWAHRLYRHHPAAQLLTYDPVMTLDADIAVPLDLEAQGASIHDHLAANGFQEELLGDDQPPATHYRLRDKDTGFYAEFLTPLVGSEYDRQGRRKVTARVAGVASQKLRYLDILLNAPWVVTIGESNGFPVKATAVQANPASFLAQKILISRKRSSEQLSKDVLYVHDTLDTFGGHLVELKDEWTHKVKPLLHRNSVVIVEALLKPSLVR